MAVSARLKKKEQAMLEILSLGQSQTGIIQEGIRRIWLIRGNDCMKAFKILYPERAKELESTIAREAVS